MTPRQAAAWLDDHGYDDVTWQIEDTTPGVPKGQQRSEQSDVAPAKGKIATAVFITRPSSSWSWRPGRAPFAPTTARSSGTCST